MIFLKNVRSISWSAFRWLFFYSILGLLFIGTTLRIYIHRQLNNSELDSLQIMDNLDKTLVVSFWFCLLFAVVFSLLFIRIFFSPLDILIGKAKSIKKGQYKQKKSNVIKESRGEWYLLDLNLNKISKDLKRKKAEIEKERGELEAIITAANDPVLAIDSDMNIRYYNAPMALFFDQKEEGHWGKPLKEVIRNHNIIEGFVKALKENKSQWLQTTHELSSDSSLHFYKISISPFFDEGKHKSHGAVAIFHDITELKKLEKVRVDFVANASHEFKTPLTSIQGYLNMIKDSCREVKGTEEAFHVVENNLNRLNRLVSDLLQLSKIESTEIQNRIHVDVRALTESVIEDLKGNLDEKHHQLTVKYEVEELLSFPDLIEHVLINLFENAIKYCSPHSDIRIHWGLKDNMVFLSVKDNGPGIESYHQSRIFERFYRIRDDKTQFIKGTGLGLSIVRHALQKLEGGVDLKSAPGMGSEFICYFPYIKP